MEQVGPLGTPQVEIGIVISSCHLGASNGCGHFGIATGPPPPFDEIPGSSAWVLK